MALPIVLGLAAWAVASLPFGVVVGRFIAHGEHCRDDPRVGPA